MRWFHSYSKVTLSVNLFLERQQAAHRFASECILLYIRPLLIGPRNVTAHFCKFEPQSEYVNTELILILLVYNSLL